MLVFVLLLAYIFLVTAAFGHLTLYLLGKREERLSLDWLSLLGFMTLTICLNIIHLIFPVGGWYLHFFALGVVGIFWKHILSQLRSHFKISNDDLPYKLCVFSILATSLLVSVGKPMAIDSMGYHAQIMLWHEKYAVVPGLANLHSRLAFHSIIFPTMTFFDVSFLTGQLFFPINGYFNLLILGRVFVEIKADFQEKRYSFLLFEWLFVVFFLYLIFANFISSPSPDYLANLFVFYIFLNLKKTAATALQTELLILLSVFLPFIKLGQFFFAALPLFFFKNRYLRAFYVLNGLLICVPYLIHNYIQSGYILFPSPFFNVFNPDWKLPLSISPAHTEVLATVEGLYQNIVSWARIPFREYSEVLAMPLSEWFPIWFSNQRWLLKGVFILAGLSPFLTLILWYQKRLHNRWIYFGFICWASTVYWFLTAPDFRFGLGFILSAALLPLLSIDSYDWHWLKGKKVFSKSVLMTTSVLVFFGVFRFPLQTLLPDKSMWLLPQKMEAGKVFEQACVNFKTKVKTPDGRCGCSDIPCTSYFLPNLEMRGTDFSKGFRLKKE